MTAAFRFEHLKITKKGQCFRLFSTLKKIKICLIWLNVYILKNSTRLSRFLNAPVMHTADHKKVEDPGLVQGIVLALNLCGVVALVEVGQPEQNV